ncbi:threonylcarbamoyl-AMP synthase [candidate division WWE3 bacterium]|uniref:L-threonylcarbamoyladenylate synthase n=1 Tax=candidate division WWE3 bacterium TaxID=2053526 RepID=A0A955LX26_UNCKA|nr:threonylcarbamoyl-AMP synthase [candidate division WWE3 bacterium]
MTVFNSLEQPELISSLQNNAVGIIPTDTIYGLVGKALHVPSVEKIYDLKDRTPDKPCIILINSVDDLASFLIELPDPTRKKLADLWPAPLSVIVPCKNNYFEYLHRGTESLAFRIPDNQELLKLLDIVGPLIAPSANPEGKNPATTLQEAQEYFNEKVEFYVDAGKLKGKPSTVVSFLTDTPTIIRDGVLDASRLLRHE